jgi:4-nitrophenyl phosphatase
VSWWARASRLPRLALRSRCPHPGVPWLAVSDLAGCQAFALDVDGTLALSDDPNVGGGIHPLPGAIEFLQRLRSRGTPFACLTNGSGQVPATQAARLRAVGLDVRDEEMITPAVVAADFITRTNPHALVLAFGNDGLLAPLRGAGIRLASLDQAEQAGVVLIGADPAFTYDKLTAACQAVDAGAPMLVTSMAAWIASRNGRLPSTSGAIAAGITHVTGAQPIVVGKPSVVAMEALAARLGAPQQAIAIVGDDVELEIRMGREAGALTVLVLSGSTCEADLERVSPKVRPHLVVREIGDLLARL